MANQYACTVIGVILREDEFLLKQNASNCEHRKSKKAKYCPICGLPVHGFKFTYRPEFTMGHSNQFLDFDVVVREEHSVSGNSKIYFIGKIIGMTSFCSAPGELPDIEQIKKKLRAKLNPLKMWNGNAFNIWTVMVEL